ncbi:MAG: UDP-2,3-diacylglucosamine diphosphatase [Fibrobacteria bacterium]|nr:UDP-2,3-diacylglucosamine diphosphatase [Fibrobacteria bacterium]
MGTAWERLSRDRDLEALLHSLPGNLDDLVLGGDIFEFWWEWTHAVPRAHLPFLLTLRDLAREGIRIHFIAGNHDFKVGDFLRDFLPAQVHPDGFRMEIGGQAWLMVHGDGMARSDRADRRIRRLLRSRWAQSLWNLVPADLAYRVAGGVGKASRVANPGPAPNIEEYRADAVRWILEHGLSGVVHGHTHRPLLERLPTGQHYINNGDWVIHRSAVWIRPDEPARLIDCRQEGHPWASNT